MDKIKDELSFDDKHILVDKEDLKFTDEDRVHQGKLDSPLSETKIDEKIKSMRTDIREKSSKLMKRK